MKLTTCIAAKLTSINPMRNIASNASRKLRSKFLFYSCVCLFAGSVAIATVETDYFSFNGLRKSVNTLQHPNAERYKDRTYVVYQGPREDPYVCAYNHNNGKWEGPFKAGYSLLGNKGVVDNHGIPVLFVDRDGYIHIIFGGHGANKSYGTNPLGKNGSGAQKHVVSVRPGDITEWTELNNISPWGTYPQVIKMDTGEIYLFYRHGSHQSNWVYQLSNDNGRTFTPPVSIHLTKDAARGPGLHDAWYAVFNKGHANTIVCAYVYHECGDGELHDKQGRFNLYFMRLNCGGEKTWETIGGNPLVMPLTLENSNRQTLIFETERQKLNVSSIYDDPDGNPHILFRGRNRQDINFTRWTGSEWQEPVLVAENGMGESGELLIKSPTMIDAIVSVNNPRTEESELNVYHTSDGGLTWRKSQTIDSAANSNYSISVRLTNSAEDAFLVIAKAPSYDDGKAIRKEVDGVLDEGKYGKVYLWGANGYVGREWAPEALNSQQPDGIDKLNP